MAVQARKHKAEYRGTAARIPILSACDHIGKSYGVGIGLYFKIMHW